ncbi:hypothetical protein AYL99_11956 [Fonsecaea erecta]|uniref:Uncharacterized protein n=1 Tax=Fonsecaea erecta TaxID=1367422 RepID=A0A178Z3R0_9EURO|nr:hypothetical protein AYL99_11956 [Fonsecaea erecta]OAP53833.1 hypothetical protein AYL99_11956 [Fonsecaea erecta]
MPSSGRLAVGYVHVNLLVVPVFFTILGVVPSSVFTQARLSGWHDAMLPKACCQVGPEGNLQTTSKEHAYNLSKNSGQIAHSFHKSLSGKLSNADDGTTTSNRARRITKGPGGHFHFVSVLGKSLGELIGSPANLCAVQA